MDSVPYTFYVSIALATVFLLCSVLGFPACHDRVSRRELMVPPQVSGLRRLLLAMAAMAIGRKTPRYRRRMRWPWRLVATLATLLASTAILPTQLDSAGHATLVHQFTARGGSDAERTGATIQDDLPGTVRMSAKDGLAAGLGWCWGGAAVAGALIAAIIRIVSAAQQPTATGDLSAFACGASMVVTALAMTVARYLFEARLQEADRSILDPSRSLHSNALTGLGRSCREPLVLHTHPLNRLPRWVVIVLLGAGASIGSQILSSLIWRLEWDLASSAQSLLCSARGARPFYTDPICGHPRDLLLRFTVANTPAYLGINTLAFFIVVYLLLPREGQSPRFSWSAVALLFEKLFSKAPPGQLLDRARLGPRFGPWLLPRTKTNDVWRAKPCAGTHWADQDADSTPRSDELLTLGPERLLLHVGSAHQQIYVVAGEVHATEALLWSIHSALDERSCREPADAHRPKLTLLVHSAAVEPLAKAARRLGASLHAFHGEPRRLVVAIDPALSCGSTYVSLPDGAESLSSWVFGIFDHVELGRAARIHDAIALLLEDSASGTSSFRDSEATELSELVLASRAS